jgi:hypothetical protein
VSRFEPVVVELHQIARLEAGDAAEHYESVQEGLGDRFATALEVCLEMIGTVPLEQPPWLFKGVPEGVRHSIVRGFPFSVVFVTEPRLVAVAVRHHAQHPTRWLERLGTL